MRDLENRVYLLTDKLHTAEREAQAVPALPVEVVAPEPTDSYEVVGVDEDGVEIVYVEDAADPRTVTARRLPNVRSPNPPAMEAPSPRRTPNPHPVWTPQGNDRIAVTNDIGPKVDGVLRGDASPVLPRQAPAVAPKATSRVVASKPPSSQSLDDDPRVLYKRYYEALKAGKHSVAIAGFRNFVERFPKSDFADNARYWLGEAFYDQRNYETALGEFQKVVSDYSQGNKVPDALLKIGFCHLALGQVDQARAALRRLIESFPKSKPAALATQRLESLEHD